MKILNKFMTILLGVCILSFVSCGQEKKIQVQPDPIEPFPLVLEETQKSQEALLSPVQFTSYDIVHQASGLRSDEGDTLFILVPPLDSNFENLSEKAKNLIKRLVVLEKRAENISIHIFDNAQALEEVFQDSHTEDLNVPVHYLAKYTSSPEEGVYRCSLIIFPIAPDSNMVVKSMSDIIEFDPYNW
jgi:hypothetical protein